MEFKLGDKIRCVDDSELIDIVAGEIYKVGVDLYGKKYVLDEVGHANYAPALRPKLFTIVTSDSIVNNDKTAKQFLERAVVIQKERADEYEQQGGERSVEQLVGAFNAITGHQLEEEDGWLFLMLLKAVRAWNTDDYHDDSALDLVSYASLVAEALSRKKEKL